MAKSNVTSVWEACLSTTLGPHEYFDHTGSTRGSRAIEGSGTGVGFSLLGSGGVSGSGSGKGGGGSCGVLIEKPLLKGKRPDVSAEPSAGPLVPLPYQALLGDSDPICISALALGTGPKSLAARSYGSVRETALRCQ